MKFLKITGIVISAVVLTALGIDASDTLSGSHDTLLAQLISFDEKSVCPEEMVHVPSALTFTCVDRYEASAAESCPHQNPINELESKANADSPECKALSAKDANPWGSITREQAALACTRVGKRLPKSSEWYVFAAGTSEKEGMCNIASSGSTKTGVRDECLSAVGVNDAIGNVWEWVADDVIDGMYEGRKLPQEGYVVQVDAGGVATQTGVKPSDLFYSDYLWSEGNGAFGMLRGGFYGSRSDAGVYAVQARTLPTSVSAAVGFRCIF
jgi:formylglycine-generating enzyme required for sulfatase activity